MLCAACEFVIAVVVVLSAKFILQGRRHIECFKAQPYRSAAQTEGFKPGDEVVVMLSTTWLRDHRARQHWYLSFVSEISQKKSAIFEFFNNFLYCDFHMPKVGTAV